MITLNLIVLILVSTLLAAFGALYLKKGANYITHTTLSSFLKSLLNRNIIMGVTLYGLSTLAYLTALKSYNLSIVYPLVSITYIWVALLSTRYLNERINIHKWVGIGFIVLGAFLIA